MKFTKENSGYVCHRCFYISFSKNDMNKHCNKKNLCKANYNCLYSDNEFKELSVNNRYYFMEHTVNINLLSISQLICLVTKYNNNIINIINNVSELSNYNNKKSLVQNKNLEENLKNNLKNNLEDNLEENLEDNLEENLEENLENKELVKKEDYTVYIDGVRKFKCLRCGSIYLRKENLERHFKNSKNCESRRIFNLTVIEKKELNNMNHPSQINIQNLNNNVQNNNNIQNIQNINNNSSQNNYNFELKDFVENNYSHSHIPRNAIQNKDFYLHKNFLNLIMENDENKNIYFDGKYAFVYTDGGLKRIQSDKAGYLVLEKLDKAIISYIYSNPQSLKEDFSYVDRYYSVMKNKYIFDTIHKPYNLETRKFDYCETRNIRTRDKCLSEITQICNLHKDKTKEIMKIKEYDKYEIDANYQVNIPNYESSRTRNKGFIDNGKYY